jgi:hypothetical protein
MVYCQDRKSVDQFMATAETDVLIFSPDKCSSAAARDEAMKAEGDRVFGYGGSSEGPSCLRG